jgi:hypothetical protein
MTFEEFKNGIRIPVNNDEMRILNGIRSSDTSSITIEHLDESEVELARRMVSRGLLNRVRIDNSTHYVINDDNWSDE